MSVDSRRRKRAAVAEPAAREFLRKTDPVLARLIDARPDFRPRAWLDELPPLDAFGTLVFQVAGQQLSVSSTRAIISHLRERFGGHMPSAAELLAADPEVLRDSGFSARKGQTLRALAERFVDGRLSEEALAHMTDDEVEATLTEVPGIGLWTARGFLLLALDRPDVFSPATSRSGARSSERTASTTCRPRRRSLGSLIAGGPTAALPSATCSRRNTTGNHDRPTGSSPSIEKAPSSGASSLSGRRGSNPRPSAWEADALPTELRPRGH
jgi:DNA-3-methyladenine glycosylase II